MDRPRAKYRLDLTELHDRLGLPDEVTVAGVYVGSDPPALFVVVWHPDGDTAMNVEAPVLPLPDRHDQRLGLVAGLGLGLVAAERARQITGEGFGPGHDADHEHDALALAGAVYATPEDLREYGPSTPEIAPDTPVLWPFAGGWKPTPHDRVRELVKAGALIVAEIDRLLAPQVGIDLGYGGDPCGDYDPDDGRVAP